MAIGIWGNVQVWLVIRAGLSFSHFVSCFHPAAVADVPGEGDELMLGLAASSFLTKKAFVSLNSAAREVFETTLAPEASTLIVS